MKILYIEWDSFGNEDMKEAFLAEGHELTRFPFSKDEGRHSKAVEAALADAIQSSHPSYVFSFNYFPLISNVCKQESVRYLSWVYDSPYVMLYSYTVINPCNSIFVFDKALCRQFERNGISTVHYLPMAANPSRLYDSTGCAVPPYLYDISFVGSLYTENHNFFDRMKGLSDYATGYLDALMNAQMNLQGCNFIEQSLTPVMDELYKALPMEPNPDGVETREYLYAQYVINRKITGLERTKLLTSICQKHPMTLFTRDPHFQLPNLTNLGPVRYYDEMPRVFQQSRINLNISLRSILSGIPQRAFDIMGSGGFLLSNFQGDFLDDFVPGEDFDYYESEEDLLGKLDYYLSHEKEREAIAQNGHHKIAEAHTYRHRIRAMLECASR